MIIGLRKDSQLNFWKFSPSTFTLPVVYVMNESFNGKWAPLHLEDNDVNIFRELELALRCDNLEGTLEILGRVEKIKIQDSIDSNLIRDILSQSQESGYLTLNKVESFST